MSFLVNISSVSNYLDNNIDENNKYLIFFIFLLNFVYYFMYY